MKRPCIGNVPAKHFRILLCIAVSLAVTLSAWGVPPPPNSAGKTVVYVDDHSAGFSYTGSPAATACGWPVADSSFDCNQTGTLDKYPLAIHPLTRASDTAHGCGLWREGFDWWGDSLHWSMRWAADQDPSYHNVGRWTPDLPFSGRWRVWAWVSFNTTSAATYRLRHRDGISLSGPHAQHGPGGPCDLLNAWIDLGQYYFDAGTSGWVELDDETGESLKTCVAWDVVAFVAEQGRLVVTKFDDSNMNGEQDPGEDEVAGWRVWYSGPESGTGLTPLDRWLEPGTYTVTEESRSGWMHTTPSTRSVTVSAGQTTTVSFGNVRLGSITTHKFHDGTSNGNNGVWDPNELPVEGWPICLTGTWVNGTPHPAQCRTTDGNGMVRFDNLPPGTYTIWEDIDFVGLCGIADFGGCRWRATTPTSRTVTLPEGDDIVVDPFGNIALGFVVKTVLDYWWREPIPEACITLSEINVPGHVLENCPALPETKCTDESGQVTFPDLLPGQYRLCAELPPLYLPWPETDCHDLVVIGCQLTSNENYAYNNPRREPRTLGFWMNWRLRYTDAEMEALIVRVKTGSEDFEDLSLATIDAALNPAGSKTAKRMATIQYLALWLNLASERLGFLPEVNVSLVPGWDSIIVDDDGIMTIHQLMLQLRALFNENAMTDQQWEIFKDICDAINNYQIFLEPPTGPID